MDQSIGSTRTIIRLAAWPAAMLVLAGCATQPVPPVQEVPGFLMGLLHGFLIFFGFLGSLVSDYRIYAFPNSGFWYDFGYLLGASAFLSGSGAGSCRRSRREASA